MDLRLADKHHRSHFRNLESEARKFKRDNRTSTITLRPSIRDYLVWVHVNTKQVGLDAQLGNPVLPVPFKIQAVTEIAMFHLLTALRPECEELWLEKLNQHLDALLARMKKNRKFQAGNTLILDDITDRLEIHVSQDTLQHSVLSKALQCLEFEPSATELNVIAWIQSLTSANVTQACRNLTNVSNIPAFVTSDILLRTPMSKEELYLQLDVWKTFMNSIGQAYHEKTSHTSSIIHNLAYYSVHFDLQTLPEFVSSTLQYFTSTKSGFSHKLVDQQFVNELVYALAFYYIQSLLNNSTAALAIIKAQEVLVQQIGHSNLSQKGYIGVTLAIGQISETKAQKLFEICQTHFHEHSTFFHMGKIYLSTSPEQLLHTFNSAVAQYPKSTALWLIFVKKLQSLELLTEQRAQKLLAEMVARKDQLIISKDLVLTLLQQIDSINGIEAFIKILEDADLLQAFKNTVCSKYLVLLYRFSRDKNVRKPYLDKLVQSTSNIDCARYLYRNLDRKTPAMVGVMLIGESKLQSQEVYNMYIKELQGRLADEHCIMALLGACTRKANGQVMTWGQLYAPQVAVHEFKTHVAKKVPYVSASEGGLIPSNKLWKAYIHVLSTSDYLAELAEVMRWWEQLQFVPSSSTLLKLLKALPREFAERHIKHANAVPQNTSTVLEWPWPTLEDFHKSLE